MSPARAARVVRTHRAGARRRVPVGLAALLVVGLASVTGALLGALPDALPGGAAAARAASAQPGLSEPPTPAQCQSFAGGRCLTPAGLAAAYDVTALHRAGTTGAGVTIGIVDSFGSPTLAHDLAVYDAQYGLPAVDLQVLTPVGTPPPFDRSDSDMAGWAGETTLDVEVAHTIAPGAKIVVIATPVSETEGVTGFPQIIAAENYVVSHHLVDVLSQSFAATEATFTSAAQVRALSAQVYPAAKAAGVTVLSSSGDNGPTDLELDQKTLYDTPQVDWPASDPLVTSVGGTMLDIGADGARASADAAWGGAPGGGAGGGGLSTVFARPGFQSPVASAVGDHRGVPDISLDAAVSSGLITYGSYSGDGWSVGGGTSQAAPMLAGIVALADQQAKARVGYLDDVLYGVLRTAADGGVVDVARGSNDLVDDSGATNAVAGYRAGTGYDLATGLGTVDGARFVPALVAATAGQQLPLAAAGGPATTVTAAPSSSPVASPLASPRLGAASTAAPTTGDHHGVYVVGGIVAVLIVLVGVGLWSKRRRRS